MIRAEQIYTKLDKQIKSLYKKLVFIHVTTHKHLTIKKLSLFNNPSIEFVSIDLLLALSIKRQSSGTVANPINKLKT